MIGTKFGTFIALCIDESAIKIFVIFFLDFKKIVNFYLLKISYCLSIRLKNSV